MNTHLAAKALFGWMTDSPLGIRLGMVSVELAVLALAAWLLFRVYRSASPRFRALVWLVVLAKPVAGLLIGAPFAVARVETEHRADGQTGIVAPSGMSVLDARLAAQLESDRARLETHKQSGTLPATATAGSAETKTKTGPAASATTTASAKVPAVRTGRILLGAWWGGLLAMLLLWFRDRSRIRRLAQRSTPAPATLSAQLISLASEIGLKRAPQLRLTDELESPALTGLLHPKIFLPARLAESPESPALQWALRHELMHCRHRDLWGVQLRRVAEVLFYFHPAVWWAGHKWEEAMELACDRALVDTNDQAREYAGKLYSLLEMQQAKRRYALGTGLFATRTQIGNRIAALLADPLRSPARLSALSLVLVLGIAVAAFSLGLGTTQAADASGALGGSGAAPAASSMKAIDAPTTASTGALTAADTKDITDRVRQADSGLRALQTALEAYKVDWVAYPDKELILTTPIAYLGHWMPDPFAAPGAPPPADQPPPDPGPEYLKMRFSPDWTAIHLYSVGPDGVDEQGDVVYDPTNGTLSEGDIVRTVKLHEYVWICDPALAKQYQKQKGDLQNLATAVDAWFYKHRTLPDSLAALKTDGLLGAIPTDEFDPERPVTYRLDKAAGKAILYSVGPDKQDDDGKKSIRGRFERGDIPTGDIIQTISLADLKKQFSAKGAKRDDPFAAFQKAIEALEKKEGRDNALACYARLSQYFPGNWTQPQKELANRVIAEGWSEDATPLLSLLALWQHEFEELRKGAAVGYAHGIGYEKGPATPTPNFLAVQLAAKMLVVQARHEEFKGESKKALDDCLAVLTMGRDFSSPGNYLITDLIAIKVRNIALKPIFDLVYSGSLDRATLERLIKRLQTIEETCGTTAVAMESERQCWLFALDHLMNHKDIPKEAYVPPEQVPAVKAQVNRFWDFEEDYFRTPYWKRDPAEHQRETEALLQSSHSFLSSSLPDYNEVDIRTIASEAKLRLCRVATGLALYRIDHDTFPSTLAELSPTYLDKIPVDPFSGEMFVYKPNADRTGYRLASVGPDRSHSNTQSTYDPTNGTTSAGMIQFGPN